MQTPPVFDNSFQQLPDVMYSVVEPTPLHQARLVMISEPVRAMLNLSLSPEQWLHWLNGESHTAGEQRIATCYAGHQFGVWAGQLGDGRAISLGELITPQGRLEIQTKGSGLTPYSRMGDGKAVIRSSVREFLCSEAMAALGIPTSRALALITGNDDVEREQIEKSALVARVFPSNIRFGHFEFAYHFKHPESLRALVDYTHRQFFADCADVPAMLGRIVSDTAKMVAQWMSVGFCHGVMNSDNMSILSFTIDYGPFGFMETFDPNWVCNHSDNRGRYRYSYQPLIAKWNLDRLLWCFSDLVAREDLQNAFAQFDATYEAEYLRLFRQKLGLFNPQAEDSALIVQYLQYLADNKMDFTYSFRQLAVACETAPDFLRERYNKETISADERATRMNKVNPKYVLRNYLAQEIIQDVEQGHSQKLAQWLEVFRRPYDEHPELTTYSLPTPEALQNLEISCSS